jgi:hypothetical protein
MRSMDDDDFGKPLSLKKSVGHSIKQTAGSGTTVRLIDEAAVQEVFDYYRKRWEKKYGIALAIPSYPAAKTTVRDILRNTPGGKQWVITMINLFLDDNRAHYQKVTHSLEALKHDMQQFAVAAAKLINGTGKTEAPPQAPLRILTDTRCMTCGELVRIECFGSANEIENVFCARCKPKSGG